MLIQFNKIRSKVSRLFAARAQSTLEYALIVAVAVGALTAMTVYVKRSVNATLKMVEKQINDEPK